MKIIKTKFRNKMEDDFLIDYMFVYVEKEIAQKFITNMIIDDFYSIKHCCAQLKKVKVSVMYFKLHLYMIILTVDMFE